MPCEVRYTTRQLTFAPSILPVFPFNFSRYLLPFHTLIEFLAANPFFSYSSLFHIFAVLSFQALADRGWGGGAASRPSRKSFWFGKSLLPCIISSLLHLPEARMSDPSTLPQSSRCTHLDALNRRCRMNLSPSHPCSLPTTMCSPSKLPKPTVSPPLSPPPPPTLT